MVRRRPAQPRLELRAQVGPRRPRGRRGGGLSGPRTARARRSRGASSRVETARLAEALAGLGIGEGDAVGIFLPMSPQAAIASHACAHLGAVQVPIFSGFAAPAIAARLADAGAKALITADGSLRRGKVVPMKEIADEALRAAPTVEHVVVWRRLGLDWPGAPGRDRSWESPRRGLRGRAAPRRGRVARRRTCSPTPPGRPASRRARCTCRAASSSRSRARPPTRPTSSPETASSSSTDMGWIMGPWTVVGGRRARRDRRSTWRARRTGPTTASGGSSRRSSVTMLGISPTLVRALIPKGDPRADLSSLRDRDDDRRAVEPGAVPTGCSSTSAAAADPIVELLRRHRGRRVLPLVSLTVPIEAGLARRSLRSGRRWTSFGPDGQLGARRGRRARLHAAVAGHDARRLGRPASATSTTYWRRFPGVWVHGDWASVDEDGYWFLHGRSDDTLNIAGKRIGPAELESAAAQLHPPSPRRRRSACRTR